jgi:hypothetical protein
MDKRANLKDIIAYVEGKRKASDSLSLLTSITVTVGLLTMANPAVSSAVSSVYTILGRNLPDQLTSLFNQLKPSFENKARADYERCRLAEILLAKLALLDALEKSFEAKDKFFARWKIEKNLSLQQKEEILEFDQKRESKLVDDWKMDSFNMEAYWEQFLTDISSIVEMTPEVRTEFKKAVMQLYEAYKNQVILQSKTFNVYINENDSITSSHQIKEMYALQNFRSLYRTIDDVDQWLRGATDPSINLQLFNYHEKDFVKQLEQQLLSDVIYVKGKTREEVIYYILYLFKHEKTEHGNNTYIIDTLENWNKLKGLCQGKILIPNFHAQEVEIIPGNTNIISFSEEDYIGNKSPIELKKRVLSNMRDQLHKVIGNLQKANDLVTRSNGLFSVFKRIVFKGKMAQPKWESSISDSLIPALLMGSWTDKDQYLVSKLAGMDYSDYMKSIRHVIGGEDPFLLKHKDFSETVYKLANLEEAWEILFNHLTSEQLASWKQVAVDLLKDVPPKFDLPNDEHFQAGIVGKGPRYSETIKKGVLKSLTIFATMEGRDNFFDILSTQRFVDEIVESVFEDADTSKKWFALSEHFSEMAEASPETVIEQLEKEVKEGTSFIWDIFEQNGDGLWGRNYYTHILWGLEKLLCYEETVSRAIFVLGQLAERKVQYKITNSPIDTLYHALLAWLHNINVTIPQKIALTRRVVKQTSIGWELICLLIPDRSPGGFATEMKKPDYRPYEFGSELRYKREIVETYQDYTRLAIEEAGCNLERWAVLFKKCFFFELNLANEMFTGVQTAIANTRDDSTKYHLKETIRELIYTHRFFVKADWSLDEKYIQMIEEEVFKKISYENRLYEYLYLFEKDSYNELHPVPYDRDEKMDYQKQRQELREKRIEVLEEIQEDAELDVIMLVNHLDNSNKMGLRSIGSIMASEFHNYNVEEKFIDDMLSTEKHEVLLGYVETIYHKHGLRVIKPLLEKVKGIVSLYDALLKIPEIDWSFVTLLESSPVEVVKQYWKEFTYWSHIKETELFEQVFVNLLENRNYDGALDMLRRSDSSDIEKFIQVLEGVVHKPSDKKMGQLEQYAITEAFETIYQVQSLSEGLYHRVCFLEWAFFSLIKETCSPKYLLKELKTDPEFVANLVKVAFKSSDQKNNNRKLSEAEQRLAQQAFSVLYDLGFCPCEEDGKIDVTELEKWTDTYLKRISESKREAIGKQILGGCFAHSPKGTDGFFPHEAVREVYERYYSTDLKKGFVIGIANQRGVFKMTNGEEEKDLANHYASQAKAIRVSFPRVAASLQEIADDYSRQSKVYREKASYDS